jgi:hypothetical protein
MKGFLNQFLLWDRLTPKRLTILNTTAAHIGITHTYSLLMILLIYAKRWTGWTQSLSRRGRRSAARASPPSGSHGAAVETPSGLLSGLHSMLGEFVILTGNPARWMIGKVL